MILKLCSIDLFLMSSYIFVTYNLVYVLILFIQRGFVAYTNYPVSVAFLFLHVRTMLPPIPSHNDIWSHLESQVMDSGLRTCSCSPSFPWSSIEGEMRRHKDFKAC